MKRYVFVQENGPASIVEGYDLRYAHLNYFEHFVEKDPEFEEYIFSLPAIESYLAVEKELKKNDIHLKVIYDLGNYQWGRADEDYIIGGNDE